VRDKHVVQIVSQLRKMQDLEHAFEHVQKTKYLELDLRLEFVVSLVACIASLFDLPLEIPLSPMMYASNTYVLKEGSARAQSNPNLTLEVTTVGLLSKMQLEMDMHFKEDKKENGCSKIDIG
jgi:hypothetical protein